MRKNFKGDDKVPFFYITIHVNSHSLKICNFNDKVKSLLVKYCYRLALYGPVKKGNRFITAPIKVYVGVTQARNIFYFHQNQLEDIISYLTENGIYKKHIELIYTPMYEPLSVDLIYHDQRKPRENQQLAIDYILKEGSIKLITLKPGEGKTFIALSAISKIKQRVCFIIKPMYIEKWINDINEAFNVKKEDILVIKGSNALKKLTHLALEDEFTTPFILISNKTYYQYIKDYEVYQKQIIHLGYQCVPEVFNEHLKIGLRIVDESHQDSHFNFRLDCYTHVPKTLALTGTLDSSNDFINKIHLIQYPLYERLDQEERKPHSNAEALIYRIDNVIQRVKFMNPVLKMYSHVKFEQSIMRKNTLLGDYLHLIFEIVSHKFLKMHDKNQKALIYFSTVELCQIALDFIQKRTSLKCIKYTAEDEYETIFNADIIISTLKSLGTAIDIPDLIWILMTDSVDSKQANLQALGRLRELKNYPKITPLFSYLVCDTIPTHRKYHHNKQKYFKNKVIRHIEYDLNLTL